MRLGQPISTLTEARVERLAKRKEQFLPRVVLARKKETRTELGCRFLMVTECVLKWPPGTNSMS